MAAGAVVVVLALVSVAAAQIATDRHTGALDYIGVYALRDGEPGLDLSLIHI